MSDHIVLNPQDNVGVAVVPLAAGTVIGAAGDGLQLGEDIPAGHKFSRRAIGAGETVVKYGVAIGRARRAIPVGAWVHTHNVVTTLAGEEEYRYQPVAAAPVDPAGATMAIPTFRGFRRHDNRVGIRNQVWIVPTTGCVNWLVERLAREADAARPAGVDAVVAFPHPYGCSQLGDDHENTRRILANLALHPNAGGIVYIGLGCENNVMADFQALVAGQPDSNPNVGYLVAQDVADELAAGRELVAAVAAAAARAERVEIPVSELCVGMKCGASDGLSGVTANPLLGAFSDWLVDRGGKTVLTEVPEMFGAERGLLNRAANEDVFRRGVAMINDFKRYFTRYNQTIYENPSPGNKEGGITTLEDKSIGCTQKGGTRTVVDVLPYGGLVTKSGVTLLSGPGNDLVSVSAMAAAGAQLILFSTGRGNPLGSPVPVVKVASNAGLARRKNHWIDFDASPLVAGTPMPDLLRGLVELVLATASGQPTRNEEHGYHDFTIFKDGVTL
ncbi:MAG: altronate dehydratase family protein [Planctomycetes bacterium]|nr:altronate dehydratase family protein [Planctomycetota bacterium]